MDLQEARTVRDSLKVELGAALRDKNARLAKTFRAKLDEVEAFVAEKERDEQAVTAARAVEDRARAEDEARNQLAARRQQIADARRDHHAMVEAAKKVDAYSRNLGAALDSLSGHRFNFARNHRHLGMNRGNYEYFTMFEWLRGFWHRLRHYSGRTLGGWMSDIATNGTGKSVAEEIPSFEAIFPNLKEDA